jgi:hypothetical protein
MAHNQQNEETKVAPQPTEAMPLIEEHPIEPTPQSSVHLPSVEDLRKQVEQGEVPPVASQVPQFVPGHIDTSAFLRAQHRFIEVQTWYFGNSHNGNAQAALFTYSKAQGEYIAALSEVLKSLGVV